MDWRDRAYSIPETAGAVTQQVFCAGRARIIVEAILGKPIGEAGLCALARREWAVHDDTRPSSTHRLWRANLASSAVSRIRCRSHRCGRDVSRTFPKTAIYCHLLPFCRRKTATIDSTVLIHFLPLESGAGRPGPGAVNRERGRRHVRNAKPAPPTCTASGAKEAQGHASQAAGLPFQRNNTTNVRRRARFFRSSSQFPVGISVVEAENLLRDIFTK